MWESGPGQRIWRWLERFGFSDDPFAVYEADQERAALPGLFIDRPYVMRIVGDPARPQSAFLLAKRGTGKTATREIVAYEHIHGRYRRRALPVRYCDFSFLLTCAGADPTHVTARHHADAIVRAVLQTLADDTPPAFFDPLPPTETALLLSLIAEFANPVVRLKLARCVSGEATAIAWRDLSAAEILTTLVSIVQRLGASEKNCYEALYLLVDRADETEFGAAALLPILKPLIATGSLLNLPGLAFKFFLPVELGEQLLADAPLLRERFPIETIHWDKDALEDMLKRRLVFYSNGRVEDFGQLCTTAARANAVDRLIGRSQESPRTLLRLCAAVVQCHFRRTDSSLIEASDITAALTEFDQKTEVAQLQGARPLAQPEKPPTPVEPPAQGLFLDEGGHVWMDGIALSPPLTSLEFSLLQALYRRPNEIVSRPELIAAVWGDADAADEQSLRKLVDRLRERLEPQAGKGAWKFIRNARGRGYWFARSSPLTKIPLVT